MLGLERFFWPVLLCVGLGFGLYKIPAVVKENLENRRESKKLQVGEVVKVLNTTGIGAPEYRQLKQLCNKFEENLRVSERE